MKMQARVATCRGGSSPRRCNHLHSTHCGLCLPLPNNGAHSLALACPPSGAMMLIMAKLTDAGDGFVCLFRKLWKLELAWVVTGQIATNRGVTMGTE